MTGPDDRTGTNTPPVVSPGGGDGTNALRAEVERLRIENRALREMLEADESQIHGEWGCGPREPYDWEPELAQNICGLATGHPDCEFKEIRHYTSGEFIGFHRICNACGAFTRWADAAEIERLRSGVS